MDESIGFARWRIACFLSLSPANRNNLNINDVLGDYSLTLVDALDTLTVSFITVQYMYIAMHVCMYTQHPLSVMMMDIR